jgi:hypothetical protein
MATCEEMLRSWGTTVLTGVAITVIGQVLLPLAAGGLRLVAKAMIKGGLALRDTLAETVAEGKVHLRDLIAEAHVEYARSRHCDSSPGPR